MSNLAIVCMHELAEETLCVSRILKRNRPSSPHSNTHWHIREGVFVGVNANHVDSEILLYVSMEL